jgi:hypothetical protein
VASLSNLTLNAVNIDSYEPNLAITEYMANRCNQSALNSLRKLNDILVRKYRREHLLQDPQTEQIIKLNIVVHLILQGKRDYALLLLKEIYKHRECFIEFMQSRVFLLLMVTVGLGRN